MNQLLELLKGGDIRSDGHADEVASDVIHDTELFELLLDGLDSEDDIVRGRTSHALEKVSRKYPELFKGLLSRFLKQALEDKLPMVRWHFAMLFVNLELSSKEKDDVISTLYVLLDDESVFVKSWSISSLTILALDNPNKKGEITAKIKFFENNQSAAVRNRVSKALKVLEECASLPRGWSKKGM